MVSFGFVATMYLPLKLAFFKVKTMSLSSRILFLSSTKRLGNSFKLSFLKAKMIISQDIKPLYKSKSFDT